MREFHWINVRSSTNRLCGLRKIFIRHRFIHSFKTDEKCPLLLIWKSELIEKLCASSMYALGATVALANSRYIAPTPLRRTQTSAHRIYTMNRSKSITYTFCFIFFSLFSKLIVSNICSTVHSQMRKMYSVTMYKSVIIFIVHYQSLYLHPDVQFEVILYYMYDMVRLSIHSPRSNHHRYKLYSFHMVVVIRSVAVATTIA